MVLPIQCFHDRADGCGWGLQFFWDGAATAFKAGTKEDRAESRAEEELRLYRLCEEGLEQPYQTNYPMPPMLMEQVR